MLVVPALLALIVIMVIGVPVPLAFLVSSVIICVGSGTDPQMLLVNGYNKINTILLLTIPLFVLAGSLINNGGLGEKLVGAVEKSKLGKSKTGLGTVTVVACAVFGAVSGSSSATVSCIGAIMAPRLRQAGYPDGLIGALIASSGVLGILIPPSMLMILFAWAANVSVLGCFIATVIPGILLVCLLSITQGFLYKKGIGGSRAVSFTDNIIEDAKQKEALKAEAEAAKSLKKGKKHGESAIPALLMPVIILGSIYTGWLTATEAAALSVLYAIPIGVLYYKKLDWKTYKVAMIDAGKTAGVIMAMTLTVQILSRLYMTENLPDLLLGFLQGLDDARVGGLVGPGGQLHHVLRQSGGFADHGQHVAHVVRGRGQQTSHALRIGHATPPWPCRCRCRRSGPRLPAFPGACPGSAAWSGRRRHWPRGCRRNRPRSHAP